MNLTRVTLRPRRYASAGLIVLALLLLACGDDDDAAAEADATATPIVAATAAEGDATPAPSDAPPPADSAPLPAATPAVADVFAHIEALAVEVGIRPAGSAGERAGAEYIRGVLEDAGYVVTLEEFETRTRFDDSVLTVGERSFSVSALNGSANATRSGRLVLAGIGTLQELAAADVDGAVVVVDRGTLPFAEKARNAEAAGAAALVVVNTEAGPLFGTLGDFASRIPVVGVQLNVRSELHVLVEAGVEGRVATDAGMRDVSSQNVVATHGDVEACRVLVGGHYDSVFTGPGANDNASGTAVALELARVYRRPGLCFVAFGAEEIGLFGSRAFVADHQLNDLERVLNIDMAGKIDRAVIVGDALLIERIVGFLDEAGGGFPIRPGDLGPFSSSDHASFERAGIPAVTINSGLDAGVIHTSADDIDNIRLDDLETMLRISDIATRGLLLEVVP